MNTDLKAGELGSQFILVNLRKFDLFSPRLRVSVVITPNLAASRRIGVLHL